MDIDPLNDPCGHGAAYRKVAESAARMPTRATGGIAGVKLVAQKVVRRR